MVSNELTFWEVLKISCLSDGIRITPAAELQISQGGIVPLSIHEYATTGGVTLEFEGGIFINAPFDEWFCNPEAVLDADRKGGYAVHFRKQAIPVKVLPLPGFLDARDEQGRLVKETIMSHTDRIRVSPIYGCAFSCRFCDFVGKKYLRRPAEQILAGLKIAEQDKVLPTRHIMISGGTPTKRDYGYLDEIFQAVIESTSMPVDVMLAPRQDDILERLAQWGVFGLSINLEIYNEEIALRLAPQKGRLGHSLYRQFIERAVAILGKGRVRSLILVGLEPEEETLKGVEFLASTGCDPVLSPFRPAEGTPLAKLQPPNFQSLERIYLAGRNIVERYGVKLGPRCIPCQHNTLTLPDSSGAYYYS